MLRRPVLAFGLVSFYSVTPPLVAEAQQAGKVYRIGVLAAGTAAQHAPGIRLLREGLRERGWVNEIAITLHERYADGRYERLPQLAAELVALKVDLIFAAGGTPAIEAAMKATRSIPIVFPTVGDPVAQKIVQSLAHPGGNVTGLSNMGPETSAKQLELFRDAVPGVKRVGLLVNGTNAATPYLIRLSQTAGQSLGIQVETFDVRDSEDTTTFEKISRAGVQALIIFDDYALNQKVEQFGGLALKYRLPMMATGDTTGVLLAYSFDVEAQYRRAAHYVDRILKGAKPADLPIEQPAKFVLVVNLKTAKELGLTIPQSILVRADEIIR
jgi:putative tryptophan/tyrosine transport system substrate-binding protein